MIEYYYKSVRDLQPNKINDFKVGCWIYVESPQPKELNKLAKKFNLEPGHLTDSIDPYEVPRLEIEGSTVYVFGRIPFSEEGFSERTSTDPVLILIHQDFIMTVCPKELPFLSKFTDLKIDFTTTQKTKLFLQFFSEINSLYNQNLNNIIRKVKSLGVNLENIKNQDIIQFVLFETILNDFLSALTPTNNIFRQLLAGKILKFYEEDKDLIEDLLLGNTQLIERSQLNLNIILNIRTSYSTIMTNNLNRIIKLLTALTIILNVPMIISSFYGMNVKLPLAGSPFAFWQIVLITITTSFVFILIFLRNRWL